MIIDLTHKLSESVVPFPGDPSYQAQPCLSISQDGFNVHAVRFSTHWGTHIDVPRHINNALPDIASVTLNTLYGVSVCIPLFPNCDIEPETEITPELLLPYEPLFKTQRHVVFQTGWSKKWGTGEYFSHAPAFSDSAIDFFTQTKIQLLGIDLPSPVKEEISLTGHKKLLENGIVILENLTNLNLLPAAPLEFILSALPIPIENLDGFPVRAVAII